MDDKVRDGRCGRTEGREMQKSLCKNTNQISQPGKKYYDHFPSLIVNINFPFPAYNAKIAFLIFAKAVILF